MNLPVASLPLKTQIACQQRAAMRRTERCCSDTQVTRSTRVMKHHWRILLWRLLLNMDFSTMHSHDPEKTNFAVEKETLSFETWKKEATSSMPPMDHQGLSILLPKCLSNQYIPIPNVTMLVQVTNIWNTSKTSTSLPVSVLTPLFLTQSLYCG